MTTAGVVVFTSSGAGHCQAGVLVNIVVSQGNIHLLLLPLQMHQMLLQNHTRHARLAGTYDSLMR